MSLTSPIRDWYDTKWRSGYDAVEISQDDRAALQESTGDGKLLRVSPFPENQGMKGSEEFFQNIHDPITSWGGYSNNSRIESFEIWFEDGQITFQYYLPDREDRQREQDYRSLIDAEYKHSHISEVNGFFPAMGAGEYLAGAEFALERTRYYPLRSVDGVAEFVYDPYRALISAITDTPENRVVLQFIYQPSLDSWSEGGPTGWMKPWKKTVADTAEHVREGRYEEGIVDGDFQDASREERGMAEVIANQRDKHAYNVNVRLLAISPKKSVAEQKVHNIASKIENQYSEVHGQKLVPTPLRGNEVLYLTERMCTRGYEDHGITLTIPELAGLAHIPNESIENDSVQWHQSKQSGSVPPGAQRFDDGGGTGVDPGVRLGASEESGSQPSPDPEPDDETELNPSATGGGTGGEPSDEAVWEGEVPDETGENRPSLSETGDEPTDEPQTQYAQQGPQGQQGQSPTNKNTTEDSSGLTGSLFALLGLGTGAGIQSDAMDRGYGTDTEIKEYRNQQEEEQTSTEREHQPTDGNRTEPQTGQGGGQNHQQPSDEGAGTPTPASSGIGGEMEDGRTQNDGTPHDVATEETSPNTSGTEAHNGGDATTTPEQTTPELDPEVESESGGVEPTDNTEEVASEGDTDDSEAAGQTPSESESGTPTTTDTPSGHESGGDGTGGDDGDGNDDDGNGNGGIGSGMGVEGGDTERATSGGPSASADSNDLSIDDAELGRPSGRDSSTTPATGADADEGDDDGNGEGDEGSEGEERAEHEMTDYSNVEIDRDVPPPDKLDDL